MDWNKDGKLDILSGGYWAMEPQGADAAFLQILPGLGGNRYGEAEILKSSEDQPVMNVPHKDVPADERKYDWQNICIHQSAGDVDGDGDLDLVVGCLKEGVFLHRNEGTEASAVLGNYGEKVASLPEGKGAPHLCDWDGDGDLDIVSGSGSGAVFLSINEGDAKAPKWGEFTPLIPLEKTGGTMSKVHVVDWDGDGRLDVLVGVNGPDRNGLVNVFLRAAS